LRAQSYPRTRKSVKHAAVRVSGIDGDGLARLSAVDRATGEAGVQCARRPSRPAVSHPGADSQRRGPRTGNHPAGPQQRGGVAAVPRPSGAGRACKRRGGAEVRVGCSGTVTTSRRPRQSQSSALAHVVRHRPSPALPPTLAHGVFPDCGGYGLTPRRDAGSSVDDLLDRASSAVPAAAAGTRATRSPSSSRRRESRRRTGSAPR
jgi:hypothetical protein